jgi:hypothetical protein
MTCLLILIYRQPLNTLLYSIHEQKNNNNNHLIGGAVDYADCGLRRQE